MDCPRCAAALCEHTVEGVAAHRCQACDGLLLAQRDLIRLLDTLIARLGGAIDTREAPAIHEDPHGIAACPGCRQPMRRFGYMESTTLTLDRCASCWLLWFDTGELLTAVQMRARTLHVVGERTQQRDDMVKRMSAIWRATSNRDVN